MNFITIEKAKTLTTKRLLTYYKKFMNEIYWAYSYWEEEKIDMDKHRQEIKEILDQREHVERK